VLHPSASLSKHNPTSNGSVWPYLQPHKTCIDMYDLLPVKPLPITHLGLPSASWHCCICMHPYPCKTYMPLPLIATLPRSHNLQRPARPWTTTHNPLLTIGDESKETCHASHGLLSTWPSMWPNLDPEGPDLPHCLKKALLALRTRHSELEHSRHLNLDRFTILFRSLSPGWPRHSRD